MLVDERNTTERGLETMADLKEEWTCTFKEVEYVYQNRPAAAGPNFVTQGTARVFKMLSKGLSLP